MDEKTNEKETQPKTTGTEISKEKKQEETVEEIMAPKKKLKMPEKISKNEEEEEPIDPNEEDYEPNEEVEEDYLEDDGNALFKKKYFFRRKNFRTF